MYCSLEFFQLYILELRQWDRAKLLQLFDIQTVTKICQVHISANQNLTNTCGHLVRIEILQLNQHMSLVKSLDSMIRVLSAQDSGDSYGN